MRAIVLALCLMATPAAAAEQFDLVCQGKSRERINAKWKPFEARLRVDLTAKGWCRDNCTQVLGIFAVEPGKITLSKSDPTNGVSPYAFQEVDRVSGAYKNYFNSGDMYWDEEATCSVAPFSGFPAAKF